MYPRLVIDMKKVQQNLDVVTAAPKAAGCSVMIVTKSFCADSRITDLILGHPQVDFLADSRIQNIQTYAGKGKPTVLLRLPQLCEVEEVVRYADISLNSEVATLRALNAAAEKQGKTHKVVLMLDLGDLREGIYFEEEAAVFQAVETILSLKNLELYGVGTNLTCYGAVIPKPDNLGLLVAWARRIEEKYGLKLAMVSGGNSSSYYLLGRNQLPAGINNLRLGEGFILGRETAYGEQIPGTFTDAVILEAQIIELQTKRSLPVGEIGMDAFGQTPYYEDRGMIRRAILALGKQDADPTSMEPIDPKIDILGSSSDHFILDVTNSDTNYQIGDPIQFSLSYGGLLRSFTSGYVKRLHRNL